MVPVDVALVVSGDVLHALKSAVEHATGPLGLVLIAIYSFLIAVALPLPSETVLLAPLDLGLPPWADYTLIILVSGAGKAAGSVLALRLGNEAKQSGPIIDLLRRSRLDVVSYSERKTIALAHRYGYVGMALALCVPFFPDTLSIYAFSVLEDDYAKFALAAFVGSAGRLIVTLALVGGVVTVL
nr:hypothetical protein [Halomarina sp. BND7]